MGIIQTWLELPVWLLLLVLAGFYTATGAALHWLAFRSPVSGWVLSFNGVVGPFFVSVLLIFALLHGFIAKEIWQRNEDAVQIVRAEGDALRALEHLTADSDPAARRLQDLIRAYAQSVVEDEWPRMRERRDAPQAEAAFARLLSAVVAAPASGGSGPEVERVRLDTVLKLHTLRGTRLAIAGDRTNELKWAILLLLGIVAQIAIAAVHLEMPRPQIAGLTIFTMAAVISLGLVAVQERPFSPPLEVPPAPLLEVVHEIPAR